MTTAARVMILGNDKKHLAMREAVLEHFWQVETTAVDFGEEPSLDVEVVVVCSSLPEPDRQQWVEKVRLDSPGMLIVKVNGFESGPHAHADAVTNEAAGPGSLVSKIYELLTERGLPSRRWPDDEPATFTRN